MVETSAGRAESGGDRPIAPRHLDDARPYYRTFVQPYDNFNRIEITLSHLFRNPNQLIGGQTYGEALYKFFVTHQLLGGEIVEIGGGLGDVMRCILQADAGQMITRCRMIDISPQLREAQREKLNEFAGVSISFAEGDCESISQSLSGSDNLVLCNGVIADLTADRLDDTNSIGELVGKDIEIAEFAFRYSNSYPYWLPTGTLRFMKELRKSLSPDATAILTEYESTADNQPTWFDNHYECGIDFGLLQAFADQIGLKATLFDMSGIIGFDPMTPLLTMDIFTARHTMTFKVPRVADLARLPLPLPVAAYSKETLAEALKSHLEPQRVASLLQDLTDYFHPISARGFDTKNPTTWTYKVLLLRRSV